MTQQAAAAPTGTRSLRWINCPPLVSTGSCAPTATDTGCGPPTQSRFIIKSDNTTPGALDAGYDHRRFQVGKSYLIESYITLYEYVLHQFNNSTQDA